MLCERQPVYTGSYYQCPFPVSVSTVHTKVADDRDKRQQLITACLTFINNNNSTIYCH